MTEEEETHRISHQSDSPSRRQPRETTAQSRGKVDKPSVERVGLVRGQGTDDQNGNDEAVDGDDTCHDDGDEGLQRRKKSGSVSRRVVVE